MAGPKQGAPLNKKNNTYSISLLGRIFHWGFLGFGVCFGLFGMLKPSEDIDFVLFMLISVGFFLTMGSAVTGVDVESDGLRIKYLIFRDKFVEFNEINRLEITSLPGKEHLIVKSKPVTFLLLTGVFVGISNPANFIETIVEKAGLIQVYKSWWRGTKFEAERK